MITMEIRIGDDVIYKGKWFRFEDFQRERLPRVFAEHLAGRLKVK